VSLVAPSQLAVAITAALLTSSPLFARDAGGDFKDANLVDYANRLGLDLTTEMPAKSKYDISLHTSSAVDGEVVNSGRLCAGFAPPQTMIETLSKRIGAKWDIDGNLDTVATNAPRLTLRITNSVTIQRCVMTSEYSSKCYVTTRVSGELDQNAPLQQGAIIPLQSEVTREVREGLVCPAVFKYPNREHRQFIKWAAKNGGNSNIVAFVNREALIHLFDAAAKKANQIETAGR
jgi:hypothetical protein